MLLPNCAHEANGKITPDSAAVAGFSADELDVTHEPNMLIVSGGRNSEDDGDFVHRGVATRSFLRRFELVDHVEGVGADLRDGLLVIDLKRELPEEMRPRQIAIETGRAKASRQIKGRRRPPKP